jgi:hypothetical protein
LLSPQLGFDSDINPAVMMMLTIFCILRAKALKKRKLLIQFDFSWGIVLDGAKNFASYLPA